MYTWSSIKETDVSACVCPTAFAAALVFLHVVRITGVAVFLGWCKTILKECDKCMLGRLYEPLSATETFRGIANNVFVINVLT